MRIAVALALAFVNMTVARAQEVPAPPPATVPSAPSPSASAPVIPAAAPAADAAPAAAQDAAQTPAAPAPKYVSVPADYVLGIDDGIAVTVYKDATFSGSLMVRPDGKITLPLLGDVQAAGMTPMALAADLTERLKKFILDPIVTVNVTAVNSKRIFFIGEVNRAGPLPLDPDMTVLQAISTAGGLTPYAKATKIYILRGPAGKQQKITFDYKKAVKTGNQQGVALKAGDTIVVP